MKKSDLLRIIKEEITKVLIEEDVHWSAINFKKEEAPSWAEQSKEEMKSELKRKYGNWLDKYLNKKNMDDAYNTFKDDPEFSKIDLNLRNKIMNSLARFFYYSSNLQEISVTKPEMPFEVKLKTIGIDKSSLDVDGIDWRDYPDFVDAYIASAQWNDGSDLDNDELNELNNMDEYIEYAQAYARES